MGTAPLQIGHSDNKRAEDGVERSGAQADQQFRIARFC
jgi:hypothetical protein